MRMEGNSNITVKLWKRNWLQRFSDEISQKRCIMEYTRELIGKIKLIKEFKLGTWGDLELLGLAFYWEDYL